MAESDSGDFEDSNYFERSRDEKAPGGRRLDNQPFDEALDVSASLDMSGAGIPRAGLGAQHKGAGGPREPRQLANDQYDEALDVSASMDVKSFAGGSPTQPPGHGGLAKVEEAEISNNPFDEVHDMSGSDDESIDTTASAKYPGAADAKMSKSSQDAAAAALSGGSTMGGAKASGAMGSMGGQTGGLKAAMSPGSKSSGVASEDESEEESDDEAESSGVIYKNAYKSSDYAHLNVGAEVRELFNYIERYKPHEVELDTTLMCFIPDYIPAVGDMDAFLKVPRPDGVEDDLGLKVLDEPSASQSDPTVLELQLRAISKKVHGDVSVRSIENAHKSPADIERWIKSIQELHRNKPPPRVTYNRSMPEIEPLMEAWPEDFERALSQIAIPPSSEMDMGLEEYVRMCCSILDIPVYDNPVESLHVMFTLYSAFKNNPHFIALQQKQLEVVTGKRAAEAAADEAAAAAAAPAAQTMSASLAPLGGRSEAADYKADFK